MSETDASSPLLPDGWVWTTLGEIIEPSKEKVNPLEIEEVPYVSLEHIEKDTGKLLGHGRSSEVRSSKTKFNRGDLLYGKLRPYLNKVYISDFEGVCSTDLLVFPKDELLSNTFFLYRFLCRDFVNYASHNVSGVNLPRVNFQTLSRFKIALPPLPEQHRIVSKIEELFTKLDAGINELHNAQSQLKRYRQSVLKAAFEGKLTQAWRAAHQDEIQPASPIAGDLPDGWVWTTLGKIIKPSKKKVNPLEIEEVPYISLEHIEKDTGKLLGHGRSSEVRSSKTKFNRGDLLYGKLRPYLNKVYVSDFEGVCSTDLLVFPKSELLSNAFFLYRFLCRDFVNYASHNVNGVNLPRVNFQTLSRFKIPLPPLPEQQAIVSEVESRLSVADAVEKTITAELKRAEQLRQSILKKAFSGQLVPQGPNDEPASVLLERTKAQKEIVF